MKKYDDNQPVRANLSPSLLAGKTRSHLGVAQDAQMGMNQALQQKVGQIGAISQQWGEMNAQIRGVEEAQRNALEWEKMTKRQSWLENEIKNKSNEDTIKSNVTDADTLAAYRKRHLISEEVFTPEGDTDVVSSDSEIKKEVVANRDELESAVTRDEVDGMANKIREDKEANYSPSFDTITLQKEHTLLTAQIADYVEASRAQPTTNVYEIARQGEQAKLFTNWVGNRYTNMTDQAYDVFKDDPEGFKEATTNFTEKLLSQIPLQMRATAMQSFKEENEKYAHKVHSNKLKVDHDRLITTTKNNIGETYATGTKMAYNGDEWGKYYNQMEAHYSTLFKNDIISGEEYSKQLKVARKEFQNNYTMGNFDRTIGLDGVDTSMLTQEENKKRFSDSIINGKAEIEKFSNILSVKEGESLQDYENRTFGYTQKEIDVITSNMENKLNKKISKDLKDSKIKKTNSEKILKPNLKNMWKGIKPEGFEELKKNAYENGFKDDFDDATIVMNRIQTLNELPLFGENSQTEYMKDYGAKKKEGLTNAEVTINSTIKANYNKNIALAKKDPNQLAVDQGMFKSILTMKGDMPSILNELTFRTGEGSSKMFVQYNTNGKSVLTNEENIKLSEMISSNPAQASQTIKAVYSATGEEEANKIFKGMYPKKSNGIIYASVLANEKEDVSVQILNGINMIKNGAKIETEDQTAMNDYFKKDLTINRLGKSAPGIRQAIEGYYYSMNDKDMDAAVKAVTNGIDNDIMVYKQFDEDGDQMDYGMVKDNMFDIINSKLKTKTKHRMNGEPTIGMDVFKDNFDDYKLVTISGKGYAFKNEVSGDYLTTKGGGKLTFTFTKDD